MDVLFQPSAHPIHNHDVGPDEYGTVIRCSCGQMRMHILRALDNGGVPLYQVATREEVVHALCNELGYPYSQVQDLVDEFFKE